jgi:uncharacterized cofD-like protein
MKKVVVIGGGTGTVSVLNGLKQYHNELELSVVVNMTDDGGSNAVVRDEFGILPLSDLRKSIIALADRGNGMLRELFNYRFEEGDGLSGHTLGNLIMMALTRINGSEVEAIKSASRLFNVLGEILPVTLDDVRLKAEYSDGTVITGEHLIDEPEEFDTSIRITKLSVTPEAKAYDVVLEKIKEAHFIIIGPGDLYTTTLANLLVSGIPEELSKASAKVIFISNLMTKLGQTHDMSHNDLVNEIIKYCKRKPDVVLINSREIPEDIKEKYAKAHEFVIEDDLDDNKYNVIREDLIGEREITRAKGDKLKRSLVRHDSNKLADVLVHKIFKL